MTDGNFPQPHPHERSNAPDRGGCGGGRLHECRAFCEPALCGTAVAHIAHDIVNVLLATDAHADAARSTSSPTVNEPHRRALDAIRSNLDTLRELASELLHVAHDVSLDSNRVQAVDLAQWWRLTEPSVRAVVPDSVSLAARLDGDLPHVYVAPWRLTRAVLNAVVNAGQSFEARRRDDREATISIGIAPDGGRTDAVRLTITDNGCGMTEEVLRRVAEPGYSSRGDRLGGGSGMTIVGRSVPVGGDLRIETDRSRGTTLAIILPAIPPSPADASSSPHRPTRPNRPEPSS